jgi:radical SAM superfamily enzyme YgiQ (UPF0313 family)
MVLINAQGRRSEKLGMFSRYVPLSIPIGVAYLAAYLIDKGHQVKIWDEAIKMLTRDDIVALIEECPSPKVFGISCLTASISRGHLIARQIKEILPEAVVILGGIHPTVLPEESLNTGVVDFVIRKEGEVPLEALYSAIKNNKDYDGISGLTFRRDGRIIHNPALPGPDMDSLPAFPYHLFEEHLDKYDFGFVVGSRGCPYNCIFCSQRSISGRRFTYRSAEKVVDDIELLVSRYNRKLITFSDDNMLTNKSRIREMCDLIQKRGLHTKASFQCQARGDDINEDILLRLKRANFVTLDFGLETASERLLVLIDKKLTVKRNVEALSLAKKFGFQLSGTFILGLPTETKEERYQSYKLARRWLDYVRFNGATPYPGTRLYEIAKSENRLNVGKDWENLNACGVLVEGAFGGKPLAYVPLGTTEVELRKDILKYNLMFSFRWQVVANLLSGKRGTSGWFNVSPRWFFDYKEWLHLMCLGYNIMGSWIGLLILTCMSHLKRPGHSLEKEERP